MTSRTVTPGAPRRKPDARTKRASRAVTVNPYTLRRLEVVRTSDVTPGMRRVTLTGEQLSAFTSANGFDVPEFHSSGFDDSVRLFFPSPGETEPVLPLQNNGSLTFPKQPRSLSKVYTVRRWDPQSRELDIDFVKHGTGIAATWAGRARPGDVMHIAGPATSRSIPVGADWLLVASDDTGLPAIARLLEELPADARAQVFIEIAEDSHRQPLRELPGVVVTWLPRHGAPAGTTGLLLEAVQAATWWDGDAFAWIAGEQAAVRDLRRHLVEERSLAKRDIDFTGYWKRTAVVALADDPAVPDPERNTNAYDRFHALTELVPPIAIRVAAGLGLGDLITRGITTVSGLADATGSNERALGKLLRFLHSIDLLQVTAAGEYGLTEVGELLTDEFWLDVLDPDGVSGRQTLGIYDLAESIRSGHASYAKVTGSDFTALRREQWYENKLLDKAARLAPYIAQPLAALPVWAGADHVVIHSDAAGALASEITAVHARIRVTICALPSQADWLRRELPTSIAVDEQRTRISVAEQSIFQPGPDASAALVVKALAPLPDADASLALRHVAASIGPGGHVFLLEDLFATDDLDEHDAESDLFSLTRTGGGHRTADELRAVIDSAGLTIDRIETFGWGQPLFVLTH